MRILHTSDWHLGKSLEGYSRLVEQVLFLEELCRIVDKEKIDLVLIAGDIYDTVTPPAAAEKMFFKYMKKIADDAMRPVVAIAGNHDNPERLEAASPIASTNGIILLGNPKTVAEQIDTKGYKINNAGECYIEIEKNNEKVVIITLPYPSEKRLNEIINDDLSENEMQKSYSAKIKEIFQQASLQYREDTINIATGHFFVSFSEESQSERAIQLGGAFTVDASALPEKAQYVALGHIHRPQKVLNTHLPAFYAGSPIAYSLSEVNHKKSVFIIDVTANSEAVITQHFLENYKPIELWRANSIEEAIALCEENTDKDCYVYLEIKTQRVLLQNEIRQIKLAKRDIVQITPIMPEEAAVAKAFDDEKSFVEQFSDFYFSTKKVAPTKELLDLFLEIFYEDDVSE